MSDQLCTPDVAEVKFWGRVDRAGPDDCWPWLGGCDRDGYGQCDCAGEVRAHRAAYSLTAGPIPPGVVVRHRCDNPPCCNPAHLLPGTQADNIRDRDERKRWTAKRGEDHGRAKLTKVKVGKIRRMHAAGTHTVGELAKRYGVNPKTVRKIINREIWAHVKPGWRDRKIVIGGQDSAQVSAENA